MTSHAHNTDEPSLNDLLSNINYHLDLTVSINNEITVLRRNIKKYQMSKKQQIGGT